MPVPCIVSCRARYQPTSEACVYIHIESVTHNSSKDKAKQLSNSVIEGKDTQHILGDISVGTDPRYVFEYQKTEQLLLTENVAAVLEGYQEPDDIWTTAMGSNLEAVK